MNCNRTITCRFVFKLIHNFGLNLQYHIMTCIMYIYSAQTNFHKNCYQDYTNNLFKLVTARRLKKTESSHKLLV